MAPERQRLPAAGGEERFLLAAKLILLALQYGELLAGAGSRNGDGTCLFSTGESRKQRGVLVEAFQNDRGVGQIYWPQVG